MPDGFPLYTNLFKQLAYLSLTNNHHLLMCTSGEDFGIPFFIYSCHSYQVICEILRL